MAYRLMNLTLSILVAILGFAIAVLILSIVVQNLRTEGKLDACLDVASRAHCESQAALARAN